MDLVEARARGHEVEVRHPWETARLAIVNRLIRRHVVLAADAVVMDIGCGDTFVVEQLAAQSPRAVFYAIDTAFTGELLQHYRERLNNPRILPFPTLDEMAPPPPRAASLILLMDVIEHIARDREFMTDLRQRPFAGADTRFLITVPAYQSLFCSHDTFLGHYRRYSNRTLRRLLEGSGYRVLDIGYFFASLVPLRLLQVARERLIGRTPEDKTGLVTWKGGRGLAVLMRGVLEADARLSLMLTKIGVRLPGLSNYAICVKSA
jgi:hypothetical protein